MRSGKGDAPALLLALLLSIFSLFQPAFAQELVWERIGVKDQHRFGGPTIVLGDINADGYPDLLHMVRVKVPRSPGPIAELQLWVLSGKNGRLIWKVEGMLASAVVGNLDGDKKPDLVVTAPYGTRYGALNAHSNSGKLTLHGQWLSLGTGILALCALSDAIWWRSR